MSEKTEGLFVRQLRVHYFQHTPFESSGSIKSWLRKKNISFSSTRLYDGEALPFLDSFDCLIVMGGPMGVYDEAKHPWLVAEKRLIAHAIQQGKKVLGVCLGAQLIAEVLGGSVFRHQAPEVGWYPIYLTDEALQHPLFSDFPKVFTGFHWHQDCFLLPRNVVRIGCSDHSEQQGFMYNNGQVVAFQFHLELTPSGVQQLVNRFGSTLYPAKTTQAMKQLVHTHENFAEIEQLMQTFLENWLCKHSKIITVK